MNRESAYRRLRIPAGELVEILCGRKRIANLPPTAEIRQLQLKVERFQRPADDPEVDYVLICRDASFAAPPPGGQVPIVEAEIVPQIGEKNVMRKPAARAAKRSAPDLKMERRQA